MFIWVSCHLKTLQPKSFGSSRTLTDLVHQSRDDGQRRPLERSVKGVRVRDEDWGKTGGTCVNGSTSCLVTAETSGVTGDTC